MKENEKFDSLNSPTRSETVAEILDSYLSVRGRNYLAILSVIFGVLSLSWLADSILPLIQDFALWFYPVQENNKVLEHFVQFIPVLLIFTAVSLILYSNHRKNAKVTEYRQIASETHRGLIVSLSNYQDFSKNLPLISDLGKVMDERRLNIESFFDESNWGQLAFVVAHHSSMLQKCWLCTTPKSSGEFESAAKLIKYIRPLAK